MVPIRAFALGKARLAEHLDPAARAGARAATRRTRRRGRRRPRRSRRVVRRRRPGVGYGPADRAGRMIPGSLDGAADAGRVWAASRGHARVAVVACRPPARSLARHGRAGQRPTHRRPRCRVTATTARRCLACRPTWSSRSRTVPVRSAATQPRLAVAGLGFRVVRDREPGVRRRRPRRPAGTRRPRPHGLTARTSHSGDATKGPLRAPSHVTGVGSGQPFFATRRRRRLAGAFFAAAFLRRLAGAFFAAAFLRRLAGAFFAAAFLRRLAGAFFAAAFLRRLAGAFFAAAFLRRLAGAFFAAAFLRRLAGAFFAAAFFRRLAGFRAVVFRAAFLAVRRLAGFRAVVFFAVDFRAVRLFAGGTVTTFLEGCSGVGAALRLPVHGGLEGRSRGELHALRRRDLYRLTRARIATRARRAMSARRSRSRAT